jgi:hypothetical protein
MPHFSFEPFDARAAEPSVRVLFALGLLAWSLLLAKTRQSFACLLYGCLLVTAVFWFWMSALPKPYGMLTEPSITERMATASVVAASGNASETCFAGEVNARRLRDRSLAWLQLEPASVLGAFEWVPLLVPALLAMGLYFFSASGRVSFVAGASLLLFWPAGAQLLPSATLLPPLSFWGDPWGAIGFFFLALAAVASERRGGLGSGLSLGAGCLAVFAAPSLAFVLLGLIGAALLPGGGSSVRERAPWIASWLAPAVAAFFLLPGLLGGPEARPGNVPSGQILLWATLGQPVWLILAIFGMRRFPERCSSGRLLWSAGSLLIAARLFGGDPVPVAPTLGVYRLGLILCAAPAIVELSERLALLLSPARGGRMAHGLLLLVLGLASPVYHCTPFRADHDYRLSLSGFPESYFAAVRWIHDNTPADAVFSADSEMAPFLAITAGRRFLRAPGLAARTDEAERERVETRILGGRRPDRIREAARRYGITHLAINGAGATDWRELNPADFEGREPFNKIHQIGDWFRVFEITGVRSADGAAGSGSR